MQIPSQLKQLVESPMAVGWIVFSATVLSHLNGWLAVVAFVYLILVTHVGLKGVR